MNAALDEDPLTAVRETLEAFRKLSPEVAEELQQHMTAVHLARGEQLFRPGMAYLDQVYLVRSGELELRYDDSHGIAMRPGDVLGLANYFHGSPYQSTVTAIDDVELGAIGTAALQQVEQRRPELFRAVNHLLVSELRARGTGQQPATGIWSLPARTFMKAPLVTCAATTTVGEVGRLMRERGIGSMGVTASNGELLGLITYRTLAQGLTEQGVLPTDPLSDRVWGPASAVEADSGLWAVRDQQTRLGVKYLVVCEQGEPAGVISQTDILEVLVSHQRPLLAEISAAEDYAQLQALSARMGTIATEIQQYNRDARIAVRALSEVHLAAQRRCIDLVLDELVAADAGSHPVDFAFLVTGSGGRQEMMINPDQDNAIILADEPATDRPETRRWFAEFCELVNIRLDEIGYQWCPGNIMARNPEYHRSLAEWRDHISQVVERPTERKARWATIFFDYATLYGDDHLSATLRDHIFSELKNKPRLLTMMVEDDASGRPAVGLFNRLVTASDPDRRGKVDLKRNGTRILADAARVLALSEGIAAVSTSDRIAALVRQGRLDAGFAASVQAALDELLDLTLSHQLQQLAAGEPLDKLVNPERLTTIQQESLRMSMRVIKTLQGKLQGEFGTVML